MKINKNVSRGFTLIELAISIIIFSILVIMSLMSYRKFIKEAMISEGKMLASSIAKIQKFYQDNGIRLNSIKEKRKEMITEYFVVEDGKVKTEVVEGVEQPLFKDVLRKKEFNDAMKEFMDKEIAIEI